MILELREKLPLDTPKGKAFAHFLIDYGQDHNLIFVCFLQETGECWSFQAPFVKLESNATMLGRVSELGPRKVKS